MLSLSIPQEMQKELERAVEVVHSHTKTVRVISHYDADGITGGFVATKTLIRAGLSPHLSMVKSIGEEEISDYIDSGTDLMVFVDIGASLIDALEEMSMDIIVLDHHRVISEGEKVIYINPNRFSLDGMKDLSGSTTAFLFALALNSSNWDLVPFALAGAFGDRQHIGGLSGINREIAEEGVKKGFLTVKRQLRLSGKTIYDSLLYSVEPFIKGITGRAQATEEFFRRAHIDREFEVAKMTSDKTDAEMFGISNYINSIILLQLIKQGCETETIENLVSDVYYYRTKDNNLQNLDELSSLVNACGRRKKSGLGFELMSGTEGVESEVLALREEHRSLVRSRLIELENNPPEKKEAIQYFYSDEAVINGAVAGIGREYLFDHDMPSFGLSISDGKVEISSRGSKELVKNGLNLAEVCRIAAEKVGGRGGGHPIASGATIPEGKDREFLDIADNLVKEQLSKHSGKSA